MKKVLSVLICFCFLGLSVFVFSACDSEKVQELSCYELEVEFSENCLYGKEKVSYVNTSENAFDKLYFHLYPNAFRQGAKNKICSSAKQDEVFYQGGSYGEIAVSSVVFGGGQHAEFLIGGEDENILVVPLLQTLFPDERVEINITFEVTLPNINHRFGIGQNTINIANFYPVACVYEDGVGFVQQLYHSNGDPFYSECANYIVKFSYPKNLTLASSGVLMEECEKDGIKTATIKGEKIRDFALVLSEKFKCVSQQVDGVNVSYYGYAGDENTENNLVCSIKALQTFNSLFGSYPYQTLSIVKASFLHGGMEFPNMVLIADNLASEDIFYVIVHEIAHQWWYGVVGNDQYNHAWLDEALAEYSTLLFFEQNSEYGLEYAKLISSSQKSFNSFATAYKKVFGKVDTSMDRALCDFSTEPEYVECTYTKGVLMMDFIRQSIGREKMIKSLKKYYQNFAFKIAKPQDFIAVFSRGGVKLENAIMAWLEGKEIYV